VLAQRTGLEPATPGVTGRYSNQLNYHCILFELPSDTIKMMQMSCVPKGIRTPVAAVKGQCPRPLDDRDIDCGAKRDRTADLLHAMQALSQLSYNPDDAN
jgi:hypothetical protein